ncbi:MAG: AIR carboxylase family protein [Nanoarchaeota archaeon]
MTSEEIGRAVIVAGSGSDKEHVGRIAKSLELYRVPYEVCVCSAHKQPLDCINLMTELNARRSPLVIIAVAGGTDALSGALSWGLYHPVISCPPDGVANQSPLHNPPGSSNATIYRPDNVGRFVAQMYAYLNPRVEVAFEGAYRDKVEALKKADSDIRSEYERASRGGIGE